MYSPETGFPFTVMCNPEIKAIETSGKRLFPESCLSVPDSVGVVKRDEHINVKFFDLNGVEREMQLFGYWSIIAQHENDHLDGVLYTERVEIDDDGRPMLWTLDEVSHRMASGELVLESNLDGWMQYAGEQRIEATPDDE
jgi:peptide deformylase